MTEPRQPRSRLWKTARLVFVAAAAVFVLRLLGVGGRPAAEDVAPPPSAPDGATGGRPPAQGKRPLTGRVVRSDGVPAPGAVVEAVFEVDGAAPPVTLASPPAGADGRFTIEGGPAAWTSLKVRARRGPFSVEADLAGAPSPIDLELRLPPTFAIGGIVIAAEDGRPLARMEVRLGDRSAVTDDFGRFQLGTLPAALLEHEAPVLEILGAGRKTLRKAVPLDARADDLLLRVERE